MNLATFVLFFLISVYPASRIFILWGTVRIPEHKALYFRIPVLNRLGCTGILEYAGTEWHGLRDQPVSRLQSQHCRNTYQTLEVQSFTTPLSLAQHPPLRPIPFGPQLDILISLPSFPFSNPFHFFHPLFFIVLLHVSCLLLPFLFTACFLYLAYTRCNTFKTSLVGWGVPHSGFTASRDQLHMFCIRCAFFILSHAHYFHFPLFFVLSCNT